MGKPVNKEGFLQKKSRHLGMWRKRWFALQNHMLYSYKEEKKYDVAPTECIDLRVYSSVKSSSDTTNKPFSFDVYSSELVFSMVAENEKKKEDWIRAVGKAIVMGHKKPEEQQQEDEEEEDDSSSL